MANVEITHIEESTATIAADKRASCLVYDTTIDSAKYIKQDASTLRVLFTLDTSYNTLYNLGNVGMQDGAYIGLGSGKGRIQFDDETTDTVSILNANVGIGTANPVGKLSIKGSGGQANKWGQNADLNIISTEFGDDLAHPVLQIAVVRQSLITGKDSEGYIGFSSIDDSNNNGMEDSARIQLHNESPSGIITPSALSFWTNTSPSSVSDPATEKMRITSVGYVGIGVTDPAEALEVSGNITLTEGANRTITVQAGASTGYDLTIQAGNATGENTAGDLILNAGLGVPYGSVYIGSATTLYCISEVAMLIETIYARDGDGLNLKDDGGNFGIFIKDGGHIGIGLNTPAEKVEINGNLTFTEGATRSIFMQAGATDGNDLTISAGAATNGDGGDLILQGGDDAEGTPGNVDLGGTTTQYVRILNSTLATNLKSGINQGAAGAIADELWQDTTDNTIKLGV